MIKYFKLMESNNRDVYYHGSLKNFEKFNPNNDVFFTKNKEFAYKYAKQKASDFGYDDEPILYSVNLDKCKIFNIKEGNNRDILLNELPNDVTYTYNNFGFTTTTSKNEIINELFGKTIVKGDEQFKNVKVGDIVPYIEYDGVYTYKLYYVVKIEDDIAYVIYLAYSTSSNIHTYFDFDKSLFHDEKYYKYDLVQYSKNRNDFNMLVYAIHNDNHELHNQIMESIQKYLDKNKNDRLYKFPLVDIEVDVENNWRYYENDDVRNTIKKLGYDGYVALEKNTETICIYKEAINKIEIINKSEY